jgi:hypothetical protein
VTSIKGKGLAEVVTIVPTGQTQGNPQKSSTGYEAGLIGGEEERGLRDLLRPTEPPDRVFG